MQGQHWDSDRSSGRGESRGGDWQRYDNDSNQRSENRGRSSESGDRSLQRWADDGGPSYSGGRERSESQGGSQRGYVGSQGGSVGGSQAGGSQGGGSYGGSSYGGAQSGRERGDYGGQDRGYSQDRGSSNFGSAARERGDAQSSGRFEPDWSSGRVYAGRETGGGWNPPSHDEDRRGSSDQWSYRGERSSSGGGGSYGGGNYGGGSYGGSGAYGGSGSSMSSGSMGGGRGQREYDSYQRAAGEGAGQGSRSWQTSNMNAASGSGQGSSFSGASFGTGDSATSRSSHKGLGPKGYRRGDDRIKEDVSEALHDHDGVDASNIEIEVQNGVITLSGTVATRAEKRLAEDCAEGCRGVDDVRNELKVSSSSSRRDSNESSSQSSTSSSQRQGSTLTPQSSGQPQNPGASKTPGKSTSSSGMSS